MKNVSIPGRLWDYLGNRQAKVARTQPQSMWRDEEWRLAPPHEDAHIASLRLALRIFDHARTREEQLAFARRLAEEPALSKPWLRALVGELKKTAKGR